MSGSTCAHMQTAIPRALRARGPTSAICCQVRPLAEPLAAATVELYRVVCRELLPTPSKSHYLFNTRDLAKTILGVMRVGAGAGRGEGDRASRALQGWGRVLAVRAGGERRSSLPAPQHPATRPRPPIPLRPQASKAFTDNKEDLLQLWAHEAQRVLGDRMWDAADRAWLLRAIDERLGAGFGTNLASLFEATGGEVRRVCGEAAMGALAAHVT